MPFTTYPLFRRTCFGIATLLCAFSAQAGSLTGIGYLPDDYSGTFSGVSGNGAVVVGESGGGCPTRLRGSDSRNISYCSQAMRWTAAGGSQGLGFLNGGDYSVAKGANADGSVIVGYATDSSYYGHAFRWTEAGGMQSLGFLSSIYSYAVGNAVSGNGAVVTGYSYNDNANLEAFRWTEGGGMQGIGFLSGGSSSFGNAINNDGSVIVGYGTNASGTQEAFRWTQAGGMQGLGFVGGGSYSYAQGVSGDGAVVVGYGSNTTGTYEAFHWTQTNGMESLGFMQGGNFSQAFATNADGSVIVGNGNNATSGQEAFYWTAANGMNSLSSLLAGQQVDIANWNLSNATGVSANGNIVVGNAYHNGNPTGYIANLATGGLTTPQDLGASLNTVVQSSQQASMAATQFLPQSIFVAQHIQQIATPVSGGNSSASTLSELSPAAGGDYRSSPLSVFVMGNYGIGQNNDSGNRQRNGTAGVNLTVAPDVNVGIGVVGSAARSDLDFGGKSKLDALGGMALGSYQPANSPLRLYGTAYVAHVSVDTTRGYLNGGGTDYSQGETEGVSYGTAIRLGWEKPFLEKSTIMPYVEGRYSHTTLDAYNETGGAFATNFGEQKNESVTTRVGVELTHPITDKTQVLFRPAWGHRFSGNGAAFDANTGGLTQTLQGNAGDRDWAEATVGAAWQATQRTSLSAELTGRSGNTSEPQATLLVGAFVKF